MGTFQLSTLRQQDNPARVQRWNASFRGGDDFHLALTVYDDDAGALSALTGYAARLALFYDATSAGGWDGGAADRDYGWGWWSLQRSPAVLVDGVLVVGAPGRVDFTIPAALTAGLFGRYRLALQVTGADGADTLVEGVLQVRPGAGAGLVGGVVVLPPVPPVLPVLSLSAGVITAGVAPAVPSYTLSASVLAFPTEPLAAPSPDETIVITNTSTVPLVITSASASGDFALTGLTLP